MRQGTNCERLRLKILIILSIAYQTRCAYPVDIVTERVKGTVKPPSNILLEIPDIEPLLSRKHGGHGDNIKILSRNGGPTHRFVGLHHYTHIPAGQRSYFFNFQDGLSHDAQISQNELASNVFTRSRPAIGLNRPLFPYFSLASLTESPENNTSNNGLNKPNVQENQAVDVNKLNTYVRTHESQVDINKPDVRAQANQAVEINKLNTFTGIYENQAVDINKLNTHTGIHENKAVFDINKPNTQGTQENQAVDINKLNTLGTQENQVAGINKLNSYTVTHDNEAVHLNEPNTFSNTYRSQAMESNKLSTYISMHSNQAVDVNKPNPYFGMHENQAADVNKLNPQFNMHANQAGDVNKPNPNFGMHENQAADVNKPNPQLNMRENQAVDVNKQNLQFNMHENQAIDLNKQNSHFGLHENQAVYINKPNSYVGMNENHVININKPNTYMDMHEHQAVGIIKPSAYIGLHNNLAVDNNRPNTYIGMHGIQGVDINKPNTYIGLHGSQGVDINQPNTYIGMPENQIVDTPVNRSNTYGGMPENQAINVNTPNTYITGMYENHDVDQANTFISMYDNQDVDLNKQNTLGTQENQVVDVTKLNVGMTENQVVDSGNPVGSTDVTNAVRAGTNENENVKTTPESFESDLATLFEPQYPYRDREKIISDQINVFSASEFPILASEQALDEQHSTFRSARDSAENDDRRNLNTWRRDNSGKNWLAPEYSSFGSGSILAERQSNLLNGVQIISSGGLLSPLLSFVKSLLKNVELSGHKVPKALLIIDASDFLGLE